VEQLHFVGFTRDNEALMLSSRDDATSGEYFVAIDEYLLAAIEQFDGEGDDLDDRHEEARAPSLALPRGALPAPARMYPKPSSDLSPRQIQARLRSGGTIADVANEAGVEEEWIIRFAAPIIAEQARVVEQAQGLTFTKPRVGPSSQPLRTSVRWNLADQGALKDDEVFDAGWSAYNIQGPRWVVRISFVAKRRRKIAEWEVDLREGELLARNRVATDLGYVAAGRRRKRADSEFSPPAPAGRADRPTVKRATRATKAPKQKKAAVRPIPAAGRASGRASVGVSDGPRKAPGRPAPAKALKKSALQRSARAPLAKKASPRKTPGTTPKKVAKRSPAAKVVKGSAKKATARKSTTKRATKKATGKRAPSKGPTAPEPALERPSHLARPLSGIRSSNSGIDWPSPGGAGRRPSLVSRPTAPAPRVEQTEPLVAAAPRRRRVSAPAPEPSPPAAVAPIPLAVPERKPSPERRPLVIMSTPDAKAGAPLSVGDAADEGSRWPLPRRRR
jgi:hypothetical protein